MTNADDPAKRNFKRPKIEREAIDFHLTGEWALPVRRAARQIDGVDQDFLFRNAGHWSSHDHCHILKSGRQCDRIQTWFPWGTQHVDEWPEHAITNLTYAGIIGAKIQGKGPNIWAVLPDYTF